LPRNPPEWTEPFPAFRVAGKPVTTWGSKGLASFFLVTTPQGNILINSDLEANVPLLQASIEKGWGFKFGGHEDSADQPTRHF